MTESSAICLSQVEFRYHDGMDNVFRDISLEIPSGVVTAVLGPNGCGKSTLLHLMLGVLAPTSGVIMLARRPHNWYSRRGLGKLVGIVSQDEYIPFNFTVWEYILLGRAPHLNLLEMPGAVDLQVAEDALDAVGLNALRGRSIQSLSGGERQLVMIARTLAQQPRILLLDEPTSHLDLSNKWQVLSVLRSLAKAGVTVVFTTHEPALASAVSEFVVLIGQENVFACGSAAEVLVSDKLSHVYGVPIEVVEVDGRRVILPPTQD